MRPAARRCPASATATRTWWPQCTRRSTSWPTRTPASSLPKSAERLGDHLVAHAPAGISHAYFVSGGSEAIEAALKLARQYFVEIGEPQRRHFIARRQSYHGNTLGALAVGGNAWRRRQFAPLLIDVTHVSPCYEYRDRRDGESSEAYGERLAARARGGDRRARPAQRHRLRRRARRRRDAGRGAAGSRLFPPHPRDLRPPRHPADRR